METHQLNHITKYQMIESDNIDGFIVSCITDGIDEDQVLIRSTIELIYYLGNILYNDNTPGNDLMLISLLTNSKSILALYYLTKTMIPLIIAKYPILRLIYYTLDLRHFLAFLSRLIGIGPTLFDSLFHIVKYTHSNESMITSQYSNANVLLKNILWREAMRLFGFLYPNKGFTIKTKETSRLCPICKDLPTNAMTFKCLHIYCYHCYMNYYYTHHNINNSIDNYNKDSNCIICTPL